MYLTNTQIDISPLTNSTLNCVRSCVKEEYPEWSEINVKRFCWGLLQSWYYCRLLLCT